jgi:phosphoribosylformylglycinamidine cyclo-ligase
MRPERELTYRITRLPPVPPVLEFLVAQAALDAEAAYSTFNMGCGLALYLRPDQTRAAIDAAASFGLEATVGGRVEEGPRQVVLEPVGVRFAAERLELSAGGG